MHKNKGDFSCNLTYKTSVLLRGFEPQFSVPKTDVLPLDERRVCVGKRI